MPGLPACCRRVAARDQVRLRTGLQREKDDMGLLLRIGADCAGALSVLPDGVTPAEAAEPIGGLTDDENQVSGPLCRLAPAPSRSGSPWQGHSTSWPLSMAVTVNTRHPVI